MDSETLNVGVYFLFSGWVWEWDRMDRVLVVVLVFGVGGIRDSVLQDGYWIFVESQG